MFVMVKLQPTYYDPTVEQLIQGESATFGSLNVDGEARIGTLTVTGVTTTEELNVTTLATIQKLNVVEEISTQKLTVVSDISTQNIKVTGTAEFAGDIKLTGVGNTRNAITKRFKASKAIAVGSVVIADPENDGQVTTTAFKGDRKVIGVAVTEAVNPGDEIEIAIGGSLQVMFDTADSMAGDLIISSDAEGMATVADEEPRIGTVLGKATSKKDINGLVWILVTLQ